MEILGLTGIVASLVFIFVTLFLGFYQKGYNHLRHTISVLTSGSLGWIQTINFVSLALSFLVVGYGLGWDIYGKNFNPIFLSFSLFAIGGLVAAIFPADKMPNGDWPGFKNSSFVGKIHFLNALFFLLIAPITLYFILKAFTGNAYWKPLIPYTLFVLISNFISAAVWFYFVEKGLLQKYKGLFQKLIVLNALLWVIIVSLKLLKLS